MICDAVFIILMVFSINDLQSITHIVGKDGYIGHGSNRYNLIESHSAKSFLITKPHRSHQILRFRPTILEVDITLRVRLR